jgi:hypothetical protein
MRRGARINWQNCQSAGKSHLSLTELPPSTCHLPIATDHGTTRPNKHEIGCVDRNREPYCSFRVATFHRAQNRIVARVFGETVNARLGVTVKTLDEALGGKKDCVWSVRAVACVVRANCFSEIKLLRQVSRSTKFRRRCYVRSCQPGPNRNP